MSQLPDTCHWGVALSPESDVPIYRQLHEQIRHLVLGERFPPGAELPSTRTIAAQFAINHMTVSKAFGLLETEGLLERRRGKAMAVATVSKHQLRYQQRLRRLERYIDALVLAGLQLDVRIEDLVQGLHVKWLVRHSQERLDAKLAIKNLSDTCPCRNLAGFSPDRL